MADINARAKGHEEYKAWLNAVGLCFSPLFPATEPLRFGPWASWSVEGLYQGLKLIAVQDMSLINPALKFEVFCTGPPALIHVPAIMSMHDDLVHHFLFQLLKSGRKYNAMRNHLWGRLDGGARNWTWTGNWRHPTRDVPVAREQFVEEVFVPAVHTVLVATHHGGITTESVLAKW